MDIENLNTFFDSFSLEVFDGLNRWQFVLAREIFQAFGFRVVR